MHLFFNEVYLRACNFAFIRPIHDVFSHKNVAAIPTGIHLESQYGYYFYILACVFALKTGKQTNN